MIGGDSGQEPGPRREPGKCKCRGRGGSHTSFLSSAPSCVSCDFFFRDLPPVECSIEARELEGFSPSLDSYCSVIPRLEGGGVGGWVSKAMGVFWLFISYIMSYLPLGARGPGSP